MIETEQDRPDGWGNSPDLATTADDETKRSDNPLLIPRNRWIGFAFSGAACWSATVLWSLAHINQSIHLSFFSLAAFPSSVRGKEGERHKSETHALHCSRRPSLSSSVRPSSVTASSSSSSLIPPRCSLVSADSLRISFLSLLFLSILGTSDRAIATSKRELLQRIDSACALASSPRTANAATLFWRHLNLGQSQSRAEQSPDLTAARHCAAAWIQSNPICSLHCTART